ncbi:DUF21 domain-containing protein [bacterium]|nr:DUF21 domain-containing protein [bacterium]
MIFYNLFMQFLFLLLLIGINAFYVAAEFALLNSADLTLDSIIKDAKEGKNKKDGAWASHFKSLKMDATKLDNYFTVVQVGITFSSLGLGVYSERAFVDLFIKFVRYCGFNITDGSSLVHIFASLVSILLLTYVHVVLGEMVPKTYALHFPVKVARFVFRPMQISSIIFHPVAVLLNKMNNFCLRVLKIDINQHIDHSVSKEKLNSALEASIDENILDDEDGEVVHGLLSLDNTIVRNVMVPRTEVIAFQSSTKVVDVLLSIQQFRCSRYPIYDKDLNDTKKLVLVRDLYRAVRNGHGQDPVSMYCKDYPIIHELVTLEVAFEEMCKESVHMAAVVDEKGGIAGIITLEDVMEEIIGGEVYDEFEEEERPPVKFDKSSNSWEVEGIVALSDLDELLNKSLSDDLEESLLFILKNELFPRCDKLLRSVLGKKCSHDLGEEAIKNRVDEIIEDLIYESDNNIEEWIKDKCQNLADEECEDMFATLSEYLDEEDAQTVGGLVMSKLAKLPTGNEKVNYHNILELHVLEVRDRAPALVEIPIDESDSFDEKFMELQEDLLEQIKDELTNIDAVYRLDVKLK